MVPFVNKSRPHLNVWSKNLVYINGVQRMTGRELKRRVNADYGPIRFVETFEAWNGRLGPHMILDFFNYADSELFMTDIINFRVPYLTNTNIQHIGIVGRNHFFELVHRDTGIDMLDCGGKPNANWRKRRTSGSTRSRSRSPRRSRSPSPRKSRSRSPHRAENDHNNSTSSDDDVGPFPSSSSLRKLIKYSIWETRSGKTHMITFPGNVSKGGGGVRTRIIEKKQKKKGKKNTSNNKICSQAPIRRIDMRENLPPRPKLTPKPIGSHLELEEGEILDSDDEAQNSLEEIQILCILKHSNHLHTQTTTTGHSSKLPSDPECHAKQADPKPQQQQIDTSEPHKATTITVDEEDDLLNYECPFELVEDNDTEATDASIKRERADNTYDEEELLRLLDDDEPNIGEESELVNDTTDSSGKTYVDVTANLSGMSIHESMDMEMSD